MKTALDFYESVPAWMHDTLLEIGIWLKALPDQEIDCHGTGLWTCHGLARAVKKHFMLKEWRVCDGFFARAGCEHSWLIRRQTLKEPVLVLDVYPIASIGGPLMMDVSSYGSAWRGLYMEASEHYLQERVKAFDAEAVHILTFTQRECQLIL